jgi:hypothetical protein
MGVLGAPATHQHDEVHPFARRRLCSGEWKLLVSAFERRAQQADLAAIQIRSAEVRAALCCRSEGEAIQLRAVAESIGRRDLTFRLSLAAAVSSRRCVGL